MIAVIGTSHIAKESINAVKHYIEEHSPAIVALELDRERYASLFAGQESDSIPLSYMRRIGLGGYVFAKIASYVQKKLGRIVNAKPGDDMRAAVLAARDVKARIAVIDQPIHITLKRLSSAVTMRDKWHFFIDILKSVFLRKKMMSEYGLEGINLEKVPSASLIDIMITHLSKRYPSVYGVLIEERNRYMAHKLNALRKTHPDALIVAVVGAGHKKALVNLLKNSANPH